jgi:hypothetical protein
VPGPSENVPRTTMVAFGPVATIAPRPFRVSGSNVSFWQLSLLVFISFC